MTRLALQEISTIMLGLVKTDFKKLKFDSYYKGKVRDVYTVQDKLIMIASDRISAFDVVLPRPIPYKGQVLNQIAATFLEATKDICPNWLLSTPDPNVAIGKKCDPIRVEMVIRAYLTGHAWRTYSSGLRSLCGVALPEGLKENDRLPSPIITPATKADEGHDEDISREDILSKNIVPKDVYETMEKYTYQLFERGTQIAKDRGLILVDTKYEFGIYNGEVILIDEIHTPDSSRYFYADTYEENQQKGIAQKHLSKEFVREWLIANNFMGKEGQQVPEMTDEVVENISNRYIELYEKVTGKSFIKRDYKHIQETIEENILSSL
jgi:phosphoribosylaminoimidazole-succinocarboxamide synthase